MNDTKSAELLYGPFPDDEFCAFIKCPGCEDGAWVGQEQFTGDAKIDCPDCGFHETIDLSNQQPTP